MQQKNKHTKAQTYRGVEYIALFLLPVYAHPTFTSLLVFMAFLNCFKSIFNLISNTQISHTFNLTKNLIHQVLSVIGTTHKCKSLLLNVYCSSQRLLKHPYLFILNLQQHRWDYYQKKFGVVNTCSYPYQVDDQHILNNYSTFFFLQ